MLTLQLAFIQISALIHKWSLWINLKDRWADVPHSLLYFWPTFHWSNCPETVLWKSLRNRSIVFIARAYSNALVWYDVKLATFILKVIFTSNETPRTPARNNHPAKSWRTQLDCGYRLGRFSLHPQWAREDWWTTHLCQIEWSDY